MPHSEPIPFVIDSKPTRARALEWKIDKPFLAQVSLYDESLRPAMAADLVSFAKLSPGANVLDLACGNGLVAIAAKQAVGPSGIVIGVDLLVKNLDEARKKASEARVDVQWMEGDVTRFDGSRFAMRFDVITCSGAAVLQFFQPHELEFLFRDWAELLKPFGRIIVDSIDLEAMRGYDLFANYAQALYIELPFPVKWDWQGPRNLRIGFEDAGLDAEFFSSQVYAETPEEYPENEEVPGQMFSTELFETARAMYQGRIGYDDLVRMRFHFGNEIRLRSQTPGRIQDRVKLCIGVGTKKE